MLMPAITWFGHIQFLFVTGLGFGRIIFARNVKNGQNRSVQKFTEKR